MEIVDLVVDDMSSGLHLVSFLDSQLNYNGLQELSWKLDLN